MGWFSKTIPDRKFPDIARVIARELKTHCDPWFTALRNDPESTGISWRCDTLTGHARDEINMLQMSVVASAFADGKFFRSDQDKIFVLELVFIHLTGGNPATLHDKIEQCLPRMGADIREAFQLWAVAMSPLFSLTDSGQTIKQLQKWLPLIVSKAMIVAYEGCGDHRTAKKIRAILLQ
jgi:hypothetical protein